MNGVQNEKSFPRLRSLLIEKMISFRDEKLIQSTENSLFFTFLVIFHEFLLCRMQYDRDEFSDAEKSSRRFPSPILSLLVAMEIL